MRIATTLLALASSVIFAAGCSDSNAPATNHVGRYELVSLNGHTLPVALADDPIFKLTVTAGRLTIEANSSFTQETTIDVVADGFPETTERLSCGGTYLRSGNHLTLTGTETDNCSAMTAIGIPFNVA